MISIPLKTGGKERSAKGNGGTYHVNGWKFQCCRDRKWFPNWPMYSIKIQSNSNIFLVWQLTSQSLNTLWKFKGLAKWKDRELIK